MADKPSDKPEVEGIRCPKCNCAVSRVYYKRNRNGTHRRVRICGSPICGRHYVTKETIVGGKPESPPKEQ